MTRIVHLTGNALLRRSLIVAVLTAAPLQSAVAQQIDTAFFGGLSYRSVGPDLEDGCANR